ncbi:MAG TPA: hypothetical protein VLA11_10255 [Woeseiaceae bacterium]|jgi:hypothetical protein|nr:hypothetical protein [Woeseiaceae bacterium]
MKSYLLHLLVILALSLGMSVPAVADEDEGAFKLEGAWVAKVVPPYFGQWSYVITSDPSGKRGTGHGSVDVGFSANAACGFTDPADEFDPTDSESPILVSMVMIGRHTVSYSAIWYGLADLGPSSPINNAIVVIGTTTGVLEFVEPGKLAGTHNFALYYPDADDDGDGYPDPGVEPACTFQLSTVDTRLPMPE